MRQASWNEMFAPRFGSGGLVLAPEVPEEPQGWRRLFWWEDLLTFGLLGIIFVAVVADIDRAQWVDDMPSLYPIALFGLVLGALLARLRWPEGFLHLLALPLGVSASLGQILAVLPGSSPVQRFEALTTRMGAWFDVAFHGGISSDDLPFIVLVVPLAWLAAYLSSWALFRWRNVWLGLVPGGAALLMNISYLPGQFSLAFVVFLLGGTLLVARLHLLERAKTWRDDGTPYPPYLSLSVLHATFWLALLLVGLAWLLPQANEASALESLWRRATAPATERVEGLSRLFAGVNNPRGGSVHGFEDILPFLGRIELPDTLAADVTTEPLGQPRYLRAQVFELYTPTGWKRASQQTSPLAANEVNTDVDADLRLRRSITVRLVSTGNTGDAVLTIGQLRTIDRLVSLRWSRVRGNVTGASTYHRLAQGDTYQASGSVSSAPEEALRKAGTDYPPWVRSLYLQLPQVAQDLPVRVGVLAQRITLPATTPYDQAVAIESYLRAIPYTLDVPDTPPGRDSVDFFLFDVKRGYFDYHASAMVVLLRSLGIPSRLGVGYVLQEAERSAGTDRYLVTERSAFAWPEVYFPGLGWVEFNPTPSFPAVLRPAPPDNAPTSTDEGAAGSGLGLEGLPGESSDSEGAGPVDLAAASSSDLMRWVLTGILSGMAAILALAAVGARYAWVRGLAGLSLPARRWEQTVRLASWARVPPAPEQTPREYALALRQRVPGLDGVDALADAYVRQRFGREEPDEAGRTRLEETWRLVRGRLLRRLLRLR